MGTVIDPHNLQVYNNANLHVMDSSVIPHTYANPVHTILAVSQKGMDVILGENRLDATWDDKESNLLGVVFSFTVAFDLTDDNYTVRAALHVVATRN